MNVLFCHDGPLEKDKNGNYYGIGFNDELFNRYSKMLNSNVSIAMRVHYNEDVDKNRYLVLSDKYNVTECPNISSIKGSLLYKKSCYDILKKSILKSDMLIYCKPEQMPTLDTNTLVSGYMLYNSTEDSYYMIIDAGIGKNQHTGNIEHVELKVTMTEVTDGEDS